MKIFPVTELHHVQNLITSVILRQTETFTEDEIYATVEENLKGTPFAQDGMRRDEVDVKAMVADTFRALIESNYIGGDTLDGAFTGRCKLTMHFPSITRF